MKRKIRAEQNNRDRVRGLAGAVSTDIIATRRELAKLRLLLDVLVEHLGCGAQLAELVRARATLAQLQREAPQPANGEATP